MMMMMVILLLLIQMIMIHVHALLLLQTDFWISTVTIGCIILPILFALGMGGNILSAIVFVRQGQHLLQTLHFIESYIFHQTSVHRVILHALFSPYNFNS
jgi:hypothetical protein